MSAPIVLAHGIAPFDAPYRPLLNIGLRKLFNPHDKFDYFNGIASHLCHHGYTVFAPRVPFAADVEHRAAKLKDHVNSILMAGRADLVCLARPHLADPYWTLHAAARLGDRGVTWPLPYLPGRDQLYRLAERGETLGTTV